MPRPCTTTEASPTGGQCDPTTVTDGTCPTILRKSEPCNYCVESEDSTITKKKKKMKYYDGRGVGGTKGEIETQDPFPRTYSDKTEGAANAGAAGISKTANKADGSANAATSKTATTNPDAEEVEEKETQNVPTTTTTTTEKKPETANANSTERPQREGTRRPYDIEADEKKRRIERLKHSRSPAAFPRVHVEPVPGEVKKPYYELTPFFKADLSNPKTANSERKRSKKSSKPSVQTAAAEVEENNQERPSRSRSIVQDASLWSIANKGLGNDMTVGGETALKGKNLLLSTTDVNNPPFATSGSKNYPSQMKGTSATTTQSNATTKSTR